MKIATYILNPDGTIPDFVIDGGYFPNSRIGDSPQDWTLVGIVNDTADIESFDDVNALVSYLESIGGLEWMDINNDPIDLVSLSTSIWSRLNETITFS